MKRFKLSRKEKLLYATPLLLPLLVWVWPLVSRDSLDRRLHELAGLKATDCGVVSFSDITANPCAVAAFQANKPFVIRRNSNVIVNHYDCSVTPTIIKSRSSRGIARNAQGQLHEVFYQRMGWGEKVRLSQTTRLHARVGMPQEKKPIGKTPKENTPKIIFDYDEDAIFKVTHVWR